MHASVLCAYVCTYVPIHICECHRATLECWCYFVAWLVWLSWFGFFLRGSGCISMAGLEVTEIGLVLYSEY